MISTERSEERVHQSTSGSLFRPPRQEEMAPMECSFYSVTFCQCMCKDEVGDRAMVFWYVLPEHQKSQRELVCLGGSEIRKDDVPFYHTLSTASQSAIVAHGLKLSGCFVHVIFMHGLLIPASLARAAVQYLLACKSSSPYDCSMVCTVETFPEG